jgi:hypothetical protein
MRMDGKGRGSLGFGRKMGRKAPPDSFAFFLGPSHGRKRKAWPRHVFYCKIPLLFLYSSYPVPPLIPSFS